MGDLVLARARAELALEWRSFSAPHMTAWADLLHTQTCYSCYTRQTQAHKVDMADKA